MYSPDSARQHSVRALYSGDQLDTASNSKILTMCFDRLDRDLATAQASLEKGDMFTTNEELGHAQDLLGELAGMIDQSAWEHAGALLAVYDYLLRLIAAANLRKSADDIAEAQRLVTEIGDAFRSARLSTAAPVPGPAAGRESTFAQSEDEAPTRFSVRA